LELHVAVNNPAMADGLVEFSIDDVLQVRMQDLDLVGSWGDYGLNQLGLGAAQSDEAEPRRLWWDDLVISTSPVGCD